MLPRRPRFSCPLDRTDPLTISAARRLPLPQLARGRPRQPMARLARHHDELTTVMTLMRDEVSEHVADVEGQVAPDVPSRRRDLTPRRKAELEKRLDSVAAALQRNNELPACDATVIDASGSGNAVFPPERLDPHAPRVVEVGCDRADRALWCSRNGNVPECGRQALDELDRDPVAGSPGRNQRRS